MKNYANESILGLTVNNQFRWVCICIVHNWAFEGFIIFIIMCNSFLLAYEDPTVEYTGEAKQIMTFAENVFMAVYTIEMIMKIIALGFVMQPHSYLRDGWNVMDFTVVILSWATYGAETSVSVIRVIRILRPLRTISAIPALGRLV